MTFLLSVMNCFTPWKNKMRVLLLFVLACLALPLSADDNGAVFKAGFLAGEWQPYVLQPTDYTLRGTDTIALQRFTAKADVIVTDSTAQHYLLTWRFHGFTIDTDSRL